MKSQLQRRFRNLSRQLVLPTLVAVVSVSSSCFGQELTPLQTTLPRDLSPWSMFMNADIVVKAIMIGLVCASAVTWTIWLAKAISLRIMSSAARAAINSLRDANSLDAGCRALDGTGRKRGVAILLAKAADRELARSQGLTADGIKERVAIELARIEGAAGRRAGGGLGIIASVGSTGPFVGLLGTVWGIMNSFIGISQSHTTNLAVVAPGIAEALLATAIGLFAAIPAVLIYNALGRSITAYRALVSDIAAQVLQHLSRDIDRARQRPEG